MTGDSWEGRSEVVLDAGLRSVRISSEENHQGQRSVGGIERFEKRTLRAPKRFAHQALDAVADDGLAGPARNRESDLQRNISARLTTRNNPVEQSDTPVGPGVHVVSVAIEEGPDVIAALQREGARKAFVGLGLIAGGI